MSAYPSWAGYPAHAPERSTSYNWLPKRLPAADAPTSLLAYGNGRTYGDGCQNQGGHLLDCRGLDHFLSFDAQTGILRAEAGVLLRDVLAHCLPKGWFLPVTPGTQYVTLGGAVANDVHGKNHHAAGSFGHHLRSLALLRSEEGLVHCSAQQNQELFKASIGGLGLTGLILWVELELKPVKSSHMAVHTQRFANLDEFYQLSKAADQSHEYTVAWVDCLAQANKLGRGVFYSANHADQPVLQAADSKPKKAGLSVPFKPPLSLINRLSLSAFNRLYYHYPRPEKQLVHYQPYFYPLDGIRNWNRIYGPKGFLQYQCVVPPSHEQEAISEILQQIAASGTGSFLAVLKRFADLPTAGMLSFPRAGTTLALDFPNRGERTFRLLDSLDSIVKQAGGAIYPAKDARMRPELFHTAYPELEAFRAFKDPAFSSSLWRRLMES
ncbi:MAG: FAD-binding oxidoreductase [Nevskiales bacterium]